MVRTEDGEEGAVAVDELGAFLLEEAEKQAAELYNYKGVLYQLIAKGVDGDVVTKDKILDARASPRPGGQGGTGRRSRHLPYWQNQEGG